MQIQRDLVVASVETIKTAAHSAPQVNTPESVSNEPTVSNVKSPEQVEKSISNLQKHLQEMQDTNMQMEYDKDIDRVVVKYVSHTSGEVVHQIPSEKFVEFEKEFVKSIGLILDKKV